MSISVIIPCYRAAATLRRAVDSALTGAPADLEVLLVDDVMTAGTAVREVIPKLKAEADVDIVGLVLSVDRMEKTKDSDLSAVAAVEKEFGFPVLAIANVREIFEAGQHIETADGTAYVTDEIKAAADAYLEQYGA